MAISETQLQTWTNAPASTKIQFTHEQVRKALAQSAALKSKEYEVYLQGSYANSTNTKGESDLDIVVQLNSTYSYDLSALPPESISSLSSVIAKATYTWTDFRNDVIFALNNYFGSNQLKTTGNKSLKLIGTASRINADIVPCLCHKKFINTYEPPVEGIKFWTIKEGNPIINYPRVHLKNGEDKNKEHRTNTKYKHAVRILKNLKQNLVEKHGFDPRKAPSYFIESTIYNVPDEHFKTDHQSTFTYAVDWILSKCNPAIMTTVSHQHLLFGTEQWQWNQQHAYEFFNAAANYYLNNK